MQKNQDKPLLLLKQSKWPVSVLNGGMAAKFVKETVNFDSFLPKWKLQLPKISIFDKISVENLIR